MKNTKDNLPKISLDWLLNNRGEANTYLLNLYKDTGIMLRGGEETGIVDESAHNKMLKASSIELIAQSEAKAVLLQDKVYYEIHLMWSTEGCRKRKAHFDYNQLFLF